MDIQEYFDKKKQVTQAKKEMQEVTKKLTSNFADNFYFKLNKRETFTNEKLGCNLTLSFFIPHLENSSNEGKKVTEILFLTDLNLNQQHSLQLTEFKGFSISTKDRHLNLDRQLFMMYPELKISDLSPEEGVAGYAMFKGVIKIEKTLISNKKFTDFCKEIIPYLKSVIESVQVCNAHHEIKYELSPKEKEVILKKFNYIFYNLMKSIDTGKKNFPLDDFEALLKIHSSIESKKLHDSLNQALDIKNNNNSKIKI